jgi:hypothetical protein
MWGFLDRTQNLTTQSLTSWHLAACLQIQWGEHVLSLLLPDSTSVLADGVAEGLLAALAPLPLRVP